MFLGREPWSSGYGSRLTFQRSWVRIPAPDTGWTFFTLICCKNCIVCLKRPKIKTKKRPGLAQFLKINVLYKSCWWTDSNLCPLVAEAAHSANFDTTTALNNVNVGSVEFCTFTKCTTSDVIGMCIRDCTPHCCCCCCCFCAKLKLAKNCIHVL